MNPAVSILGDNVVLAAILVAADAKLAHFLSTKLTASSITHSTPGPMHPQENLNSKSVYPEIIIMVILQGSTLVNLAQNDDLYVFLA